MRNEHRAVRCGIVDGMARLALLVAGIVVLAAATTASADTAPWSVGITDARKAKAKQFLDAGNALLLDKEVALALEQYNSAVAQWDHPAIRFNIVRCLILLDKLPEASENLKLTLKFGAAPLEEAVYNEALAYQKLLANQIAEVTVTCAQPGVSVTLDGQPIATCPGNEMRRVKPGTHQVVGTKAGLLTLTVEVFVVGGAKQEVPVRLEPLSSVAKIEHRWATWIPWMVFGGGFAIAGIGGAIALSAASDRDSYDRTIQQNCSTFTCSKDEVAALRVDGLDDSARRNGAIAIGVIGVGAVAVATGAVMLYLNRGRRVYADSMQKVTPTIGSIPGGATLMLGGRF